MGEPILNEVFDLEQEIEDNTSHTRSFTMIMMNRVTGEVIKTYSYQQVLMTLEEYRNRLED